MEKGVIEKILIPDEKSFYCHTSPYGTIWVETIRELYEYYKDKNKDKAELLKDLLDFAPEKKED